MAMTNEASKAVCRISLLVFATILLAPLDVSAQERYGPFDYTNPEHVRKKLPIVEQYHFNSDVENLRAGMTGYIHQDLAYTLRVFPNHHRALNAMGRLWRTYEQQGKLPRGAKPNQAPDYWFRKAMRFAPHDGTVPLLYAIHLQKLKNFEGALTYYKKAEKLLPSSPEVHYNLGLLYVDRNDFHLAKLHAKKAYDLGFPLPGLRNKLIRAGVWER
jgi:tetratricopeptide (TPR) repeat protein